MLKINIRIHLFLTLFLLTGTVNLAEAQHDADSLRNILVTLSLPDNFEEVPINYNDSILDLFHRAEPSYKNDILPADLGNIGSACISEDFFKRPDSYLTEFLFNEPFKNYILGSQNIMFYNTRRPYTSVFHTTSTKTVDLQTIDFIHTQNVNPNLNLGIQYNFISSLGQYLDQANSLNSVGITSNYKKNKYKLFVSYIFNKFKLKNSGGYIDTLGADLNVPEHYLQHSVSTLFNQEFSVTQKYILGNYKNLSYRDTIIKVPEPKFSISHNLRLARRYRVYTDEETAENNYYLNFFYKNGYTYDSVAVKSLSNSFKFESEKIFEEKHKFGFDVAIHGKLYNIYNFKNYIFEGNTNTFFENRINGNLHSDFSGKIHTEIYGDYFFGGYRSGDYRIRAKLEKTLFKDKLKSEADLKIQYTHQKPDYFINTYYSNHYIWENNFSEIDRTDLSFSYLFSYYRLKFNVNSALINNYVYYDITSMPAQADNSVSIISASAEKTFNLKRFTFINKILWEKSSDDNIISLPELSLYQSVYLKMLYNKTLLIHLGFEVYYSSEYKSFNFNPATGQFYFENNNKKLTGNYPYVTVFADMKIKRNVMLFFKFMHINSFMNTETLPYYVTNYPLQNRLFKFGVRWTFKN